MIENLLWQRVPEQKGGIQNIGFMNKISLPVIEWHFVLTPNRNLEVNYFHYCFLVHLFEIEHIKDFRVVGGLKLLCWVVGTILFPNNHMTHKSY